MYYCVLLLLMLSLVVPEDNNRPGPISVAYLQILGLLEILENLCSSMYS